ncbi:MAG: UTP--glucose-1-phosphate uridylyltransferase [Campylobacterales bacterium]|nr:UTP--glucose-1-phosphate uridylyltransferase [Campylobacterales bacterium]
MSEIRYDRLHNNHVIIAPERLHRPTCDLRQIERRSAPRACPFCQGNESHTPPEIYAMRSKQSFANEIGWSTRVVPNLYKAVQIETPHKQHFGMFEYWEGFGAHEVVIDIPNHYTSMTQWDQKDVVNWLRTLQLRYNDLKKDTRLQYLSIFKNEGLGAGATQPHCHTQIIGLPFVPKQNSELFHTLYEHYKHNQNSLIETMIDEEMKGKISRIIASRGEFVAFCPFASSHPFEIMISSKKALGDLDSLSLHSIEQVAPLLLEVMVKLQKQLHCLEYNLILSTPPLQESSVGTEIYHNFYDASRFYIRILPRVYNYGGFEHDSGIFINPVAPEIAAKLLKEG